MEPFTVLLPVVVIFKWARHVCPMEFVLFYYGQSNYWITDSRGVINTGTRLLGFSGELVTYRLLHQLMNQISIVLMGTGKTWLYYLRRYILT